MASSYPAHDRLALWSLAFGNVVIGTGALAFANRIGPAPVIVVALVAMTMAFLVWTLLFAVGPGNLGLVLAVVAAVLWAAGNFARNSMQQARLVNLAPALASVSVALNTSAIYFGQCAAVGGYVPSHPFTEPSTRALLWVALRVFFVAITLSIAAQHHIERGTPRPLLRDLTRDPRCASSP